MRWPPPPGASGARHHRGVDRFRVCLLGTVMAVLAILSGRASVLYTFYPPLLASTWYYFGVSLLIGGSMIWVVLMIVKCAMEARQPRAAACRSPCSRSPRPRLLWAVGGMRSRHRAARRSSCRGPSAGRPRSTPASPAHSVLGDLARDRLFLADAGLYRLLHLVPQAAGGRLYSDTLGRLTFIMFLVFSLPVGMHHLFADPETASGFKFLQSLLTVLCRRCRPC